MIIYIIIVTLVSDPPNLYDELFTMADANEVTETPLYQSTEPTSWSNIRSPLTMSYTFSSDFQKGGGPSLAYIDGSKFGIISSKVLFKLKRGMRVVVIVVVVVLVLNTYFYQLPQS